ncbi:uncharacterized protein MONOS_17033 [Monocercomonoides exilis]|uniref:uncharacterized protein n=1 Tax=Monocercomonoides exilis TaxID=2049356 RepID=UPI00355A5206|nr:hypothetical protein MONOS_17033 [Monocercomonoides exilis]
MSSSFSETSSSTLEEEKEKTRQQAQKLSYYLWNRLNPGYVDDTSTWTTTTKEEFGRDKFEKMDDPDTLNRSFHKKQDEHTRYMEASARQHNMTLIKPTGTPQQ